MIAYTVKSIQEIEVLEKARKWAENKILSEEQYLLIKERHKHELFIPNVFVRVGLFVLTFILVNAALGLLSMVFIITDINTSSIGGIMVFYGIMVVVGLETIILNKKAYKAGIDDALLYMALGFLISGICLIFNRSIESTSSELLIYSLIALPFLIFAAIRYLDNVVVGCAFICIMIFIFSITIKLGEFGKVITPFVLMGTSALIYFLSVKISKEEAFLIWAKLFKTLQFLSLLSLYLSANYFVVRELSIEMFDLFLENGQDIPFAMLFQFLTFIIPLVYLYVGGKQKDRIVLWSGLLISILTVLTFKYYYSLGHHSITITLSGIFLSFATWFFIRYFSPIKNGITSDKEDNLIPSDVEALIVSYSFPQTQVEHSSGTEFGGGEFGGGGAGGKF